MIYDVEIRHADTTKVQVESDNPNDAEYIAIDQFEMANPESQVLCTYIKRRDL